MVIQELYGLFLAHHAVRMFIDKSAQKIQSSSCRALI
jgi:hypothetical protein